MATLDHDGLRLKALYRQSTVLPELIDAEICALIDKGHIAADIARHFELTPQEISRRVKRHRDSIEPADA